MRTPSVDPANAEELRNAERVILTGWKGVKSISAKMKTHIDNRGEVKHQRTGEATIDFLYTDHGVLARMWNYDVIWADVNGQKVMTGDRTTKVYDGKFLYTLEELHDSKTVYKDFYRRSAFPALGGPDLLTTIKSFPTMKFQPKMDLDGKEVYRFMCRDEKVGFASFMFVDRKTGLLLRLLVADNVNKAKSVSDFTDYVFNPEFAPDHFTLKKPDDATFEDFTKPKAPPSPISVSTRHPETEDKTP